MSVDDFGIRLKLITDILQKKIDVLKLLLNVTENQGVVLESKNKNEIALTMLRTLTDEKQRMIDEILQMDSVFQKTYTAIKHNFQNQSVTKQYKKEILHMQGTIREISVISDKIVLAERYNDNITKTMSKAINERKTVTSNATKNNLLQMYNKNARNRW